MTKSTPSLLASVPWLLLGSGLAHFIGWDSNWAVAAWWVPVFLLGFGRRAPRAWQVPLALAVSLTVVGWITVRGAWHMGGLTEVFFGFVLALPLVGSVSLDRLLFRRLGPLPRTLVFPATWVLFDYAYSFLYGLGDVFSPALTQFHFGPLVQVVSLTGIYGLTFLIGWFASVVATIADDPDTLPRWRAPAVAFGATLTAVLVYGSARLSGLDHDTPTVRVASIVLPHPRNYWEAIVDLGTPAADADRWRPELAALEDRWFAESERAVAAGAPIVFWSEAAAVMYADHEPAFLTRAGRFADEHDVYLLASSLVMFPDSDRLDNRVTMFTPEGATAYTSLKTQSWYPTESDGVIHSVSTPYGRLSSVICFDLDVPGWMQQVAAMDVDILLVPGFDTRAISPYHSEEGMFRAIEGGYGLVRGVADGTSMSVDRTGRVLGLQDAFRTREPIQYVDVPTAGRPTVYGRVGDVFAWLVGAGWLGLLAVARFTATRTPRPR
jgi:apolipoprotein N-acyltransferase